MGEVAATYLVHPDTSDWDTPGYYSCCTATVRDFFQECDDQPTVFTVTNDLTCQPGCQADTDLGPTYPVGFSTRFTVSTLSNPHHNLISRDPNGLPEIAVPSGQRYLGGAEHAERRDTVRLLKVPFNSTLAPFSFSSDSCSDQTARLQTM